MAYKNEWHMHVITEESLERYADDLKVLIHFRLACFKRVNDCTSAQQCTVDWHCLKL